MKLRIMIVLFTVSMLFGALSGYGQNVTVIKGLVFADYYYTIQYHDPSIENQNAFNFRRIYLTVENNITKNLKVRFRLESSHEKYGTATKIRPFVKHAFLEWNDLIPNHKLYFGIAETNAFKNAEIYWGYRSIEKNAMDLNKIGASADMGIGLKGDINKVIHHWLTVHNGTGFGSAEVDRYKKIGYALWLTPVKGIILEGYADYEKQDPESGTFQDARDLFHSSGYYTVKGFMGFNSSRITIGAEVFMRTHLKSGASSATVEFDTTAGHFSITNSEKTDVKKIGYSLFASLITPIPNLKLFMRYDYFDVNNRNDVFSGFDSESGQLTDGLKDEHTRFFAGLDYAPIGNVHIMPNIIYKMYSDGESKNDLIARVTLYYNFDSGKIII